MLAFLFETKKSLRINRGDFDLVSYFTLGIEGHLDAGSLNFAFFLVDFPNFRLDGAPATKE